MKFLADEMLGQLAKWLRVLGYDTLYHQHLDDNELVRLARAQGRLILTRDTKLTHRRGVRCLFIKSELVEEQLPQVLDDLGLALDNPFSRCSVCNAPLEEIEKSAVKERVPPYVFRTQERFKLCPQCGRIYWRGTHWDRMKERIEGLETISSAKILTRHSPKDKHLTDSAS